MNRSTSASSVPNGGRNGHSRATPHRFEHNGSASPSTQYTTSRHTREPGVQVHQQRFAVHVET